MATVYPDEVEVFFTETTSKRYTKVHAAWFADGCFHVYFQSSGYRYTHSYPTNGLFKIADDRGTAPPAA